MVLNRIIRVNLAQKLNLKPRLEGSEGVRLRGERVSDSEGKGPEVGACLVCSKNRKMASDTPLKRLQKRRRHSEQKSK